MELVEWQNGTHFANPNFKYDKYIVFAMFYIEFWILFGILDMITEYYMWKMIVLWRIL